MSILTVNHLSIAGRQYRIVHHISFEIHKGEWFALVGQSGSGKSMTASAIGQLLPANLQATGEIWYEDKNLITSPPPKCAKFAVNVCLISFKITKGPLLLSYDRASLRGISTEHLTLSRTERIQQAKSALVSVGLSEEFYTRYPFQLSGGQLQRVSIAIALLLKPDILIAGRAY